MNVITLLEMHFVDRFRGGVVVRWLRLHAVSQRTALVITALRWGALVLLLYVLPGLALGVQAGDSRSPVPGTLLDLGFIAFFYLGMFVGANAVYSLTYCENMQLLALPITLRDLADFRWAESLAAAAQIAVLLLLPVVGFQCHRAGWSYEAVLFVISGGLMCLVACFGIGEAVILLLWSRRPRIGPDRLFLNIFLGSVLLLAAFVRFHRTDPDSALMTWLADVLSRLSDLSIPALVGRWTAIGNLWVPLVLWILGCLMVVVMSMRAARWAVRRGYVVLHGALRGVQRDTLPRGPGRRLHYQAVARALSWLPPAARALLTNDVLALTRRPELGIKVLAVVAGLVLVSLGRQSYLPEPRVFALYFVSAYLVFRLHAQGGGPERGATVVVQRAFPRPLDYLRVRFCLTCLVSLLPVGLSSILFGALLPWQSVTHGAVRVVLIAANFVCSCLAVSVASAVLAPRGASSAWSDRPEATAGGILGQWIVAGLSPFVCYRADLALAGHSVGGEATGILAATLVLVLGVGAILAPRRLQSTYIATGT
jgi:hypothetical protein